MTVQLLDLFAQKLVEARDASIRSLDGRLRDSRAGNKALAAARWRDAESAGKLPEVLIPDCVDAALFYLLDAIDSGRLRLRFEDESGEQVDLGESQEIGGWFVGQSDDAWRQRFSQERIEPAAPKSKKPEGTQPKKKKR